MSSVLKSKIDTSRLTDESEAVPSSAVRKVEPMQNMLCEALKAMTSVEFEPSHVIMSPVAETDIQTIIEAPGLKLSFHAAGKTLHSFGSISPALAIYVSKQSLLFSNESTSKDTPYEPSKLDCLLLQPIAEKAAKSLSHLLATAEPLNAQIGLTYNALGASKPQFKALGRCTTLRVGLAPLLANADAAEPEFEDGALFIDFILPKTLTQGLMQSGPASQDSTAPVIDPSHPWAVHMRSTVNKANVPVRAVVESCSMTVAECTRLEIGQVIALPGVSLDSVQLFIDMESGAQAKQRAVGLANGSLGIYKKNRALKMNENIDPDFIQDLNLHII